MPGGLALLEIEGQEEDVFISESNVGSALHGDTVQVTLLSGKSGKRQEGAVVRVLAHEITELVGNYERAAILDLWSLTT